MSAYSHIIIGAGSAGCTLANRLTEEPDTQVLLLEAGGWDRDPHIQIPLLWPRMFLHQRNDWGFYRTGGKHGWPSHRGRSRQGYRRLVLDERHGVRAWPPGGL